MYRERLVGCLDCGDRFKIIYDSKKEQQDKYTCKCGKLVCYPDSYGSFDWRHLYPSVSSAKLQTWKIYKYIKEQIPEIQ